MRDCDREDDYPIDPEKIKSVRDMMMNEVRARASEGDAFCGSLLAIESEFADYLFFPEYDSDLSDIDDIGPF